MPSFHLSFRQKRRKVDVKFHEENDTVSYRQIMSYFFQPQMSAGLLNDSVVMINLPLMVSSHKLFVSIKQCFKVCLCSSKVKSNGNVIFSL